MVARNEQLFEGGSSTGDAEVGASLNRGSYVVDMERETRK